MRIGQNREGNGAGYGGRGESKARAPNFGGPYPFPGPLLWALDSIIRLYKPYNRYTRTPRFDRAHTRAEGPIVPTLERKKERERERETAWHLGPLLRVDP